ncbi:hypothetical protein EV175_002597 [Coemansia sp. RSA 1933]|nr:hypothetical protein EV175_002597 [Coemansia sp. RSA 1933]
MKFASAGILAIALAAIAVSAAPAEVPGHAVAPHNPPNVQAHPVPKPPPHGANDGKTHRKHKGSSKDPHGKREENHHHKHKGGEHHGKREEKHHHKHKGGENKGGEHKGGEHKGGEHH